MADSKPQSAARARVLVVDDHPAIREALAIRIDRCRDLAVCGEAEDEAGALKLLETTHPDAAVIDISLKDGNGIELIKRIKARSDRIRMLVWSTYDESLYAERALRAGAMGYVSKEKNTAEIVRAIRQILGGRLFFSEDISQRLLARSVGAGRRASGNPEEALSDRELEVYRMIGRGQTTREIAAQLHLSIHTVETHRQRIKAKLGLGNTAILSRQATQWLLENG